jgi:hypothetical protein
MRSAALNDYASMLYYMLMPADAVRFIDVPSDASGADFGASLSPAALGVPADDASAVGLPQDSGLFPLSAATTKQLRDLMQLRPTGRAAGKVPPIVFAELRFPPPRTPVLEAMRTMACDGACLYVHDYTGLGASAPATAAPSAAPCTRTSCCSTTRSSISR